MKYSRCVFQLAGVILGGLALTSCGSGGSGDGGIIPPIGSPTHTIVSGTVMAPGGAVAFFKRPSLGDLFVSDAYAALTGLANVPDNTVVQLARLNANASNVSVITTTTTSEGRYSFNLTTLGLQPSNDLIVRTEGSGGKQMRAFVVGSVADISPVSEAAYQLAIQSLNGRLLSNLTLQEVADISGAVGIISMLQNIGTATSVDQAVALVKTSVAANAQVTGFITAAAAAGQTPQGTGDVGNFYPFEQGNIWRYNGTRTVSGPTIGYDNTVFVSGQGPAPIHGVNSTIFTETNDEGEGRAEKSYGVKGLSGITSYGNDDPNDNISRQLAPFQVVHFPLTLGATTILAERDGLDWGEDEDGDGRNETFNIKLFQTVLGTESVIVPAGNFPIALKIVQKAVFIVMFTTGRSATLIQTNTGWHVSGVGAIKELVQAQVEGGPVAASHTEELLGYVVNGQGSGLRIELMSPATSITTTLGGTKQLQATAYDQQNRPLQGLSFFWSSANTVVASVDQTGLLTGASPGSTMVKASIGGLTSNSLPIAILDLRLVSMYTRDIAYDPVSNRIYGSVGDNSGNLSNTLVAVNPETGTIEWSAVIGPTPGKLTISDDGQYLYVGVNEGKTVAKVNLSTRSVQQSFNLGNYAVLDMVTLGGSSNSLVIARQQLLPSLPGGVAVYDNGVQRPLATPGWGESEARDNIPTILERGISNSIVYGAGHGNVFTISISASGATIRGTQPISIDDREMVYSDGLLYFPSGEVYSPITSSLQGTYPVPSINSVLNKVLPYPSLNKVFFALWFPQYRWLAFDQTTLAPAGSVDLLSLDGGTSSPLRLIRWGSNGLALSTEAGQVFIFRSSLFQ
jgi:hypothetical protein